MPAFTNDDLKTLGAFDQAQNSTDDQLRLLRSVANRIGLYDAADAILNLLVTPAASPRMISDSADDLIEEVETLSQASDTPYVMLDADISDRIAATIEVMGNDEAVDFARRIMVDLHAIPAQTAKIAAMSTTLAQHILGAV